MTDTQPNLPPPSAPRRKATMRLSQKELSQISLAVVIFVIAVLGLIGYRAMLGFRTNHDLLIAKQNLHQLHEAFYGYAQDWDQRLPQTERWTDAIFGYLSGSGQPGGPQSALHGPGDEGTVTYVYNELAAGYSLESGKLAGNGRSYSPSKIVLLIERAKVGPNTHVMIPPQVNPDAEQALYKELQFPHGADDPETASTVVLYADGSQKVWTRHDLKQ